MISNKRLRRIALHCQGLDKVRPFGTGSAAALRAVEHLGYVQIDTLSVVERAHHHTLWSRLPDYAPSVLDQLVRERTVFEYWSHAASYLPMCDYRFALPRMSAAKKGRSVYAKADPKYVRQVRARIRGEGPLKARDFATASRRSGTWWNWKPAKRALEQLFMQGDLMVTERDGMQKVYDLAERVLPDDVNTAEPSVEEFAQYLVRTSLKANGFTTLQTLTHLRSGKTLRDALANVLLQQAQSGAVVELETDEAPTIYIDSSVLSRRLPQPANTVRLLSPFDNAVIHRDKVQRLFDFAYRMECYVPESKRKFGYFCLPVLFREALVGQVDCKAHRQTGTFEVIHLHLNGSPVEMDSFVLAFTKAVQRFAAFNGCHRIVFSKASPAKLAPVFRRALKQVE